MKLSQVVEFDGSAERVASGSPQAASEAATRLSATSAGRGAGASAKAARTEGRKTAGKRERRLSGSYAVDASDAGSGGHTAERERSGGTWVSLPGMPGREREGGEAVRNTRRRERMRRFTRAAREAMAGRPAKARRARDPSFGEGCADRSAEASDARSRKVGKPELRRRRATKRRRAGCARSLGTLAFHLPPSPLFSQPAIALASPPCPQPRPFPPPFPLSSPAIPAKAGSPSGRTPPPFSRRSYSPASSRKSRRFRYLPL